MVILLQDDLVDTCKAGDDVVSIPSLPPLVASLILLFVLHYIVGDCTLVVVVVVEHTVLSTG